MTNTTKAAKTSLIKQAATGVAFALAPFAIVAGIAGIAAMDAPSAEARAYFCRPGPGGYGTFCSYGR